MSFLKYIPIILIENITILYNLVKLLRQKGAGVSTIYKRGSSWRGQMFVGETRVSVTCRTKKEVEQKLSEILTDYNRGKYVFKDDITVAEWGDLWLEDKRKKIQEQSMIRLEGLFTNHVLPFLGDVKLQELSKEMLEEMYARSFHKKSGRKYHQMEYSHSTVNAISFQFKTCLRKAVDEGLLNKNPHDGVELHKLRGPKKVHAYTVDEHRKIVEYTKSRDSVFYFLIATGVRVGEACALSWSDVSLNDGTVNITKTVVSVHGSMLIQDHPKTEKSIRTIHLAQNTADWLRDLYKKRDRENNYHDLVFPTSRFTVHSAANLRKYWKHICAEIGVPYYGLHALRHTWATRALEQSVDIKTVSDMLGHKNIITTMNIYQDVLDAHKKEAAKKMNALF